MLAKFAGLEEQITHEAMWVSHSAKEIVVTEKLQTMISIDHSILVYSRSKWSGTMSHPTKHVQSNQ